MEKDQVTKYLLLATIILLLYLTFLMTKAFLGYIIMGVILTFISYPIYKWLLKKTPNKSVASGIMILAVLLVIILPLIFVMSTLAEQAGAAFGFLNAGVYEKLSTQMSGYGVQAEKINEVVSSIIKTMESFFLESGSELLGSLATIILGLFIMFFIMYYGFKDGEDFYKSVERHIPLETKHKTKLLKDIRNVSKAVLYGQILTAIVQGTIGGIGFLIFGVPNAVFWGFVMVIISFIPIIGTPIIWLPAALIELFNGNIVSGIGLLVFNGLITMNIDNVLKPLIISGKSQIHPVAVLLGVIGGLMVFGLSGIILGPLIIALLITVLKFYTEEKGLVN